MLRDPVKRETIKAGATSAAAVASVSEPRTAVIAVALAGALGIAVEALGSLGEKRTKELFNTQGFIEQTINEIKESDDFAGFVYDVWLKHNLESSEERRKRLKAILQQAVSTKSRDFENFTRIITVAHQISEKQLILLKVFYEEVNKQGRIKRPSGQSLSGYVDDSFKMNASKFSDLLAGKGFSVDKEGGDGIVPILNQLSYFGLIGMYIAMDGEYYMDTRFGKVFLDYINN